MRQSIFLLYVAMASVTYLPRMLPLVVLSRVNMPARLMRWLSFVPVAVLAALLSPDLLLVSEGDASVLWLSPANLRLLAAIPTFFVALRTKNLYAPVITGLCTIFILNLVF